MKTLKQVAAKMLISDAEQAANCPADYAFLRAHMDADRCRSCSIQKNCWEQPYLETKGRNMLQRIDASTAQVTISRYVDKYVVVVLVSTIPCRTRGRQQAIYLRSCGEYDTAAEALAKAADILDGKIDYTEELKRSY